MVDRERIALGLAALRGRLRVGMARSVLTLAGLPEPPQAREGALRSGLDVVQGRSSAKYVSSLQRSVGCDMTDELSGSVGRRPQEVWCYQELPRAKSLNNRQQHHKLTTIPRPRPPPHACTKLIAALPVKIL
jgi:hypothetical protein